jgi:hypothetical protein
MTVRQYEIRATLGSLWLAASQSLSAEDSGGSHAHGPTSWLTLPEACGHPWGAEKGGVTKASGARGILKVDACPPSQVTEEEIDLDHRDFSKAT